MVEDWVANRLVEEGKVVLRGELAPIGNIFGGLMFPVLSVSRVHYVGQPDPWPSADKAIRHIESLPDDRRGLVDYFQDNLDGSRPGREWFTTEVSRAHELAAAALLSALSPRQAKACLAYLIEDFWGRRAGWPDLIVLEMAAADVLGVELVEVKSKRDRLGTAQKAWFAANEARLHLPASVLRVVEDGPRSETGMLAWPYEPPPLVWASRSSASHPVIRELVTADRTRRDRVRREVVERCTAFTAQESD